MGVSLRSGGDALRAQGVKEHEGMGAFVNLLMVFHLVRTPACPRSAAHLRVSS